MGYNEDMAETDAPSLQPGESRSNDSGERRGCSAGGRLVQLRRRVAEPGFVVVADAEPRPEVPTEVITTEWAVANAAFDRLMKEY
ncbi:hypothetical protein GCM10010470_31910 [Saccharopolyspora taberi]|uniref:Uncharacterized protein n=2 Tax=Saccharopolyspora taberi TaxID=60895 RepID=A0ABN3VEX8_9PSEU